MSTAGSIRGVIVVFALLGIGVIAVLAVLLSRPRQLLSDDPVAGRPFQPPGEPFGAADLAAVRFPIAVRGYRMADVDAYVAAAVAALWQAQQHAGPQAQVPAAGATAAGAVDAMADDDSPPDAQAWQPPSPTGPGN